jgi:hypothetical protein
MAEMLAHFAVPATPDFVELFLADDRCSGARAKHGTAPQATSLVVIAIRGATRERQETTAMRSTHGAEARC